MQQFYEKNTDSKNPLTFKPSLDAFGKEFNFELSFEGVKFPNANVRSSDSLKIVTMDRSEASEEKTN